MYNIATNMLTLMNRVILIHHVFYVVGMTLKPVLQTQGQNFHKSSQEVQVFMCLICEIM